MREEVLREERAISSAIDELENAKKSTYGDRSNGDFYVLNAAIQGLSELQLQREFYDANPDLMNDWS